MAVPSSWLGGAASSRLVVVGFATGATARELTLSARAAGGPSRGRVRLASWRATPCRSCCRPRAPACRCCRPGRARLGVVAGASSVPQCLSASSLSSSVGASSLAASLLSSPAVPALVAPCRTDRRRASAPLVTCCAGGAGGPAHRDGASRAASLSLLAVSHFAARSGLQLVAGGRAAGPRFPARQARQERLACRSSSWVRRGARLPAPGSAATSV